MTDFLGNLFNFAGTFSPQLLVLIFLTCIAGEIWTIGFPYVLETIWLLAGYSIASGILSPLQLFIMWVVAMAGRYAGVVIVFYLSRLGSVPLTRLYQKYVSKNIDKPGQESKLSRMMNKIKSHISPFSVAFGRLFGLLTLTTIALGIKKQYRTLILGVLLASIVFDALFIITGVVVGGNTKLEPVQMLLLSLGGLTAIYIVVFIIRHTVKFIKSRWNIRHNQPKE